MDRKKTVLITGAAGNLGSLLAAYLQPEDILLNLLIHKKDVDENLRNAPNVRVFRGDLAQKETLFGALDGVDTVIHFAGVLFRARPEKFLHTTNTVYFRNLADAAVEAGVKRLILVSFPHVEGESRPHAPATGRLDGTPESVHARTRLEEERYLFNTIQPKGIEAVSLRVGMVYGRGILMIDAARWFSRHGLLGVWKSPNSIHLISTVDFLRATRSAMLNPGISGIYHLGDDDIITLQEFLDRACRHWKGFRPWRMPWWMIATAARLFEGWSTVFGTRSPLTLDFIRIGRASYYGDTSRMKRDLLPELAYPTLDDGLHTL